MPVKFGLTFWVCPALAGLNTIYSTSDSWVQTHSHFAYVLLHLWAWTQLVQHKWYSWVQTHVLGMPHTCRSYDPSVDLNPKITQKTTKNLTIPRVLSIQDFFSCHRCYSDHDQYFILSGVLVVAPSTQHPFCFGYTCMSTKTAIELFVKLLKLGTKNFLIKITSKG